MRTKLLFLTLLFVFSALFLGACGGAAPAANNPATTEVPVVIADASIISDGRLVPVESVELAFATGGQVEEVLAEEGDVVKAGDVIARLSNREPLESSIAAARLESMAAEQELLDARQALKALHDNLPEAQTQALEAIKNAREALREAERKVNGLSSPSEQTDIDSAKSSVVLAKDALDKAKEDYEPYANKPEDNLIRAVYLGKLAEAQNRYDDAVRRLNYLEGVLSNDFDLSQAQAELEIAQARLDQAEADYNVLRVGPDPEDIALAESRIATAEARIVSSEAALAASESALADLDLVATIDGTVISNDLIAGQQISPGIAVVTLADFSRWYIETDNLTEIDVVDVGAGDAASIIPDALPDLKLSGQVESIADFYEEKQGDVTYTARILVKEADPRLRWGMTVIVTFDK